MKRLPINQPALFVVVAAAVTGLWARLIWILYSTHGGLFRDIASDWGGYFAQAAALVDGKVSNIYDLQQLTPYRELLGQFTANPDVATYPVPVPYPALFAWLFSPLTHLPPPIGFGLWTILNVLAGVWLALRIAQFFEKPVRPWVFLVLLGSFPIVRQFISGQTGIWIAIVVAEMYLSLRSGRELRAGLWLGCLIFKPQLAILIGPLLLWKRRWSAVGGAALSGLAILAGSAAFGGLDTLLALPRAMSEQGGIHGFPTTAPQVMVNWRALILLVRPEIGDRLGLALVIALGGLTVLCALPAFRGRWSPREPIFPLQMGLLVVTTLLVSYHSHADYISLLALPFAAILTQVSASRLTRLSIVTVAVVPTMTALFGSLLPPISFAGRTWLGVAIPFPPLYAFLLLICFAGLVWDVRRLRMEAFEPAAPVSSISPYVAVASKG